MNQDLGVLGYGWLWSLALLAIASATTVIAPLLFAYIARLRKGKLKEQGWADLLALVTSFISGSWAELYPIIQRVTADGKVERRELEELEKAALEIVKRKAGEESLALIKKKLGTTFGGPIFDEVLKGVVGLVVRQQLPTAAHVSLTPPVIPAIPAALARGAALHP